MIWLIRLVCLATAVGMIVVMLATYEGFDETQQIVIRIVAGGILALNLRIWYQAEKEK